MQHQQQQILFPHAASTTTNPFSSCSINNNKSFFLMQHQQQQILFPHAASTTTNPFFSCSINNNNNNKSFFLMQHQQQQQTNPFSSCSINNNNNNNNKSFSSCSINNNNKSSFLMQHQQKICYSLFISSFNLCSFIGSDNLKNCQRILNQNWNTLSDCIYTI